MFELLKKLQLIPTITTREEIFLKNFTSLIPEEYRILNKNIIFKRSKSKYFFAAHYDNIGLVLEDYLGNNMYLYSTRGLINNLDFNLFRTLFNKKEIKGIVDRDRIIIIDNLNNDLPALYPFAYDSPIKTTKNKIIGAYLDNKIAVALLLDLLRSYDFNLILLAGEEQGTTRLGKIAKEFHDYKFVCIDSTSALNPHDNKGISKVSYRAIEGAGYGNIAPPELVLLIKKYIKREATSYSKYQISDATTFYRYNLAAINISYPLKYLHSFNEVANIEDIKELKDILVKILEELN